MLRYGRFKSLLLNQDIELDIVQISEKKTLRLKQYTSTRSYDATLLAGVIPGPIELSILNTMAKVLITDISDRTIRQELIKDNNDRLVTLLKVSKLVIACNQFMADLALQHANDVLTLPTAVEVCRYRPMTDRAFDSKIRLLWIGDYSTLHYLLNIAPILEEIGKRYSEVVLRVISDKYFKLKHMPVEPVLNKLEYTYNALSDCDIGIAPLREGKPARLLSGHNIRQMYAGGLPVIASPVGESGDMVIHEINGLLAQNSDQWINSLSLLIENLGIGTQYGTAGREMVKNTFDTSIIAEQLAETLKEFDNSK